MALVIGCEDILTDIENFVGALEKKMPQKKFDIILSREYHSNEDCATTLTGWDEATIDELRVLLSNDEFNSILNIKGTSLIPSSVNNNSKRKGKNGKSGKNK